MGRVLIIAALLWLGYTLYRRYRRKPRSVIKDAKLIQCGVCGVYLPQADATALPSGEFRCAQHAGSERTK